MVVSELRGEKIDIIPYNDEPARFVAKALSPARVREVIVDDDGRQATVIVPDDQLSLAIGREGQNARLAARLTGWRIDIKSETEFATDAPEQQAGDEESGRCQAILTSGRRCPNASLPGSAYCGLDAHQALRRFETNAVAVVAALSDDEVAQLVSDASDEDVAPIVQRAQETAAEAAAEAEARAAEEAAAEAAAEAEAASGSGGEAPAGEPDGDGGDPEAQPADEPAAGAEPEPQAAEEPAS
jgi:N utilization substance protein A